MISYKMNVPTSLSTKLLSQLMIQDIEKRIRENKLTVRSPTDFTKACNEVISEFVDETAKEILSNMKDTIEYQTEHDEYEAEQKEKNKKT